MVRVGLSLFLLVACGEKSATLPVKPPKPTPVYTAAPTEKFLGAPIKLGCTWRTTTKTANAPTAEDSHESSATWNLRPQPPGFVLREQLTVGQHKSEYSLTLAGDGRVVAAQKDAQFAAFEKMIDRFVAKLPPEERDAFKAEKLAGWALSRKRLWHGIVGRWIGLRVPVGSEVTRAEKTADEHNVMRSHQTRYNATANGDRITVEGKWELSGDDARPFFDNRFVRQPTDEMIEKARNADGQVRFGVRTRVWQSGRANEMPRLAGEERTYYLGATEKTVEWECRLSK